jgi:tRNA-specific 2-thiouridylase
VLGVLNQDQLRRSYFPLGATLKADVRSEARDRGLAIAEKPDSHDICFIANGDTAGFLEQRLGHRPGDIVDMAGAKVGQHAGSHRFTVGQRRGLRLGTPAPDGRPRFVLSITPTTNTVTVGPRDALAVRGISTVRPTWTAQPLATEWSGEVQVRAHGHPMVATVWVGDQGLQVVLDAATAGVAPGQAIVLYEGSRVVGSATISATQA